MFPAEILDWTNRFYCALDIHFQGRRRETYVGYPTEEFLSTPLRSWNRSLLLSMINNGLSSG